MLLGHYKAGKMSSKNLWRCLELKVIRGGTTLSSKFSTIKEGRIRDAYKVENHVSTADSGVLRKWYERPGMVQGGGDPGAPGSLLATALFCYAAGGRRADEGVGLGLGVARRVRLRGCPGGSHRLSVHRGASRV